MDIEMKYRDIATKKFFRNKYVILLLSLSGIVGIGFAILDSFVGYNDTAPVHETLEQSLLNSISFEVIFHAFIYALLGVFITFIVLLVGYALHMLITDKSS